jgi:hypothetical protein
MTCIQGVHVCCTPRIGLVGPEDTRNTSIRGVQDICTPQIWDYPWRTDILYASDAMPRPAQTHPTKGLWRAWFLYATAMAATVAYTFIVRLRYIAVAYRFLREHSSYDLFPSSENMFRLKISSNLKFIQIQDLCTIKICLNSEFNQFFVQHQSSKSRQSKAMWAYMKAPCAKWTEPILHRTMESWHDLYFLHCVKRCIGAPIPGFLVLCKKRVSGILWATKRRIQALFRVHFYLAILPRN